MTLVELRIVAIAVVVILPAVVIAVMAQVVEARRRARARVWARQIRLTDAVHAEFGAVVAPVVEKRVFRPWRVVFPLRAPRAADISRLVAITERVLAEQRDMPDDVQIVFTRPAPLPRTRAA